MQPEQGACTLQVWTLGSGPGTKSLYLTAMKQKVRDRNHEIVLYGFGRTGTQPKRGICSLPFQRKGSTTQTGNLYVTVSEEREDFVLYCVGRTGAQPERGFVLYRFGGMGAQPKQGGHSLPCWKNGTATRTGSFYFTILGGKGAQPERGVSTLRWLRAQPKRGVSTFTVLEERERNPNGEFLLYHFGKTGMQPKGWVCVLFWKMGA